MQQHTQPRHRQADRCVRNVLVGVLVFAYSAGTSLALSGLGRRVLAQDKPSAEYVNAMQTMAVVAKEMPERLAANDVPGMDKLVIAARPAIGVLDAFWSAREAEDAKRFVATASKAISEISVAVHLMTDGVNPIAIEGAQESIKALTGTCTACHQAHRTTLPDGTFAIR